MVYEDDQYLVGGLILFNDLTGTTLSHMTQMTPALSKKAMTYYQDAYPSRPQQMHLFNIPSFFDAMFNMIRPFMKEKMQQRVSWVSCGIFSGNQGKHLQMRVHNTSRIEEMYQYIPKSILPTEYGGDAGPIQDMIGICFWVNLGRKMSYFVWFQTIGRKKLKTTLRGLKRIVYMFPMNLDDWVSQKRPQIYSE